MNQTGKLHAALSDFKDWSNYLLVTTVVAIGWTAEKLDSWLMGLAILAFVLSAILGIGTLALIPLVREAIDDQAGSIFDVRVGFQWLWRPTRWKWTHMRGFRLKKVCWPQHVSFGLGLVLFCIGSCIGNSATPKGADHRATTTTTITTTTTANEAQPKDSHDVMSSPEAPPELPE